MKKERNIYTKTKPKLEAQLFKYKGSDFQAQIDSQNGRIGQSLLLTKLKIFVLTSKRLQFSDFCHTLHFEFYSIL